MQLDYQRYCQHKFQFNGNSILLGQIHRTLQACDQDTSVLHIAALLPQAIQLLRSWANEPVWDMPLMQLSCA